MSILSKLGCLSLISSLMVSPTIETSSARYASEQEAVKAAADIYNPISIYEDREYMGTIFRKSGKFGYNVSRGKKNADKISISIPAVEWDNVIAFWHTHGGADPINRYFSNQDTEVVRKYGKAFYLADYTGFLKVFRTGSKTMSFYSAARLGLPSMRGYATGEVVRDENNRTIRVKTRRNKISS